MTIEEVHAKYRDFYNYIRENHPIVFNQWLLWYDKMEKETEEALKIVRKVNSERTNTV